MPRDASTSLPVPKEGLRFVLPEAQAFVGQVRDAKTGLWRLRFRIGDKQELEIPMTLQIVGDMAKRLRGDDLA